MKIGLVAEGYPPMSGGVATSAKRLATELVREGHQVIVLTFDNTHDVTVPDLCSYVVEEGVRIYRFGPFFLKNPHISKKIGMLTEKHKAMLRRRAFNQMLRVLSKDTPDILLSFYLFNAGFMAQMLGNALDLPVVAGVRGNDIGRNIFDSERFAAIEWTLNHAAAVACVNRHLMKRTLIAFPQLKDKTLVTQNGLLPEQFIQPDRDAVAKKRRELVEQQHWNDDDLILSFAGSLREKKGVIALTRALCQVNAKHEHIRLLVIGPDLGRPEHMMVGDLWDDLCSRGIVHITGQISRAAVPELIAASDVACYPSNEDGMANSLLESMAMGLPSIVTDIFDDVISDGKNGFIVPADDEDALSEVMEYTYSHRSQFSSLGQAAYDTVCKHFTAEAEAHTYITLFNQILGMPYAH